jgi:Site-specific DNA methylase
MPNHSAKQKTGIVLERIRNLPPGGKMGDLPKELQHPSYIRIGSKKTGGPNLRLIRLENDKPSLTVTAYIFNKFVHPSEDRFITPREAASLQDFPNNYEFCGSLSQVHKQIGNAVPVKLAKVIAMEVAKYFKRRNLLGNKYIASYFTGAGGLDLGFEEASNSDVNFITAFSTDIEEYVEKTIKRNRPQWNFYREDIRKLSTEVVLNIIGKKPDIIIGGPPCQTFSVAGKQKATKDPLGILYRDFVRNVKELEPKIVVMENVYGLAQVKEANMINEIYKAFEDIGYNLTHRELLAADYGTPQMRRRLFFIAAKEIDNFEFPEPTHFEQENLFGYPLYNGAGKILMELPDPVIE